MKKILISFVIVAATLSATNVWAQFSVEDKTKTGDENVKFRDQVKNIAVSTDYYNDAKARAERARLRKERNYIELQLKVNGAMTTYNDAYLGTRGGDNAISVWGELNLKHIYNKNRFSLTTQAQAQYGYNRIRVETEDGNRKGIWFKNMDQFWAQTQPVRNISNAWGYSGLVKLRSQFSNSYRSRTQQTDDDVLTGFLAPAYIDVSIGISYNSQKPKFPIKLALNPLSSNGTIAFNDLVERNYNNMNAATWFGIDMSKHALFSGGSSVNISFDRAWGKTQWFKYWTNCYVYYGWITNVARHSKISAYKEYLDDYDKWVAGGQQGDAPAGVPKYVQLDPTVEWKNRLTFRASKFLETTLEVNVYYDKTQCTSAQIQSVLKLGIAYTFKNK